MQRLITAAAVLAQAEQHLPLLEEEQLEEELVVVLGLVEELAHELSEEGEHVLCGVGGGVDVVDGPCGRVQDVHGAAGHRVLVHDVDEVEEAQLVEAGRGVALGGDALEHGHAAAVEEVGVLGVLAEHEDEALEHVRVRVAGST